LTVTPTSEASPNREHRRLCEAYFDALASGRGDQAAGLFCEDGVLDDLIGTQHAGRTQIESFISARPELTLEVPLNVVEVPDRINYYGRIHFGIGTVINVRWIFTFDGEFIRHLCNSQVRVLHGVATDE
jgi:hypothetical protein